MEIRERLKNSCEKIANDITEGIIVTEDNLDEYEYDLELGDSVRSYDYLRDCLDWTYTIGSDGKYRGIEVLVAFGGPNIYIDCNTNTVLGKWGSSVIRVPFVDSMDIKGWGEEMFECDKGSWY
jgi:hypothetical protein